MARFILNRIEIDLAALRHNYLELQRRVGSTVEVLAMVKADAYGHGLVPAASTLARAGARIFGVAEIEEGISLRQAGISGEIILLLGAPEEGFPEVVAHRLSPVVFDLSALEKLSRQGEKSGAKIPVHLKVDVGMGRVGIPPAELPLYLERMAGMPGVRLAGISSHLPMADQPADPRTDRHCRDFEALVREFRAGIPPERTGRAVCIHLANSAAVLGLPQTHFDMVRPGIALYGCHPGGLILPPAPVLRPVMSFKSKILQLKEVPAGHGVSYGHSFVTGRPSRLAVLPVGYDDGYLRRLSNRAMVLIGGRRVPLRGNICMNASIADVTDVPGVKEGDEVVLLGSQGEERIDAQEIAGWLETIHYEVLCLLGSRNARVYCDGEQDQQISREG